MYLQGGNKDEININLGFTLLGANVDNTQITQSIIIGREKPFIYYNRRFLAALNSGLINQTVYDLIKTNQNDTRQILEINNDLQILKTDLTGLVKRHNIEVDTDKTGPEIIADLNALNYQIIKKL
jgi:hypothetical protein